LGWGPAGLGMPRLVSHWKPGDRQCEPGLQIPCFQTPTLSSLIPLWLYVHWGPARGSIYWSLSGTPAKRVSPNLNTAKGKKNFWRVSHWPLNTLTWRDPVISILSSGASICQLPLPTACPQEEQEMPSWIERASSGGDLPSKYKALSSIPSSTKKKKKRCKKCNSASLGNFSRFSVGTSTQRQLVGAREIVQS
jgi:hypothetical protein